MEEKLKREGRDINGERKHEKVEKEKW